MTFLRDAPMRSRRFEVRAPELSAQRCARSNPGARTGSAPFTVRAMAMSFHDKFVIVERGVLEGEPVAAVSYLEPIAEWDSGCAVFT